MTPLWYYNIRQKPNSFHIALITKLSKMRTETTKSNERRKPFMITRTIVRTTATINCVDGHSDTRTF